MVCMKQWQKHAVHCSYDKYDQLFTYELKNCKILYYQLVCILETAVYVSCLALISFHGLNQFYLDLFKETSLITVKVWNVDKFKFTIWISSYTSLYQQDQTGIWLYDRH